MLPAIEPDSGTILIGGEDVTDVPPEYRGVGMAFQNFALFPHMSAYDNIASSLTSKRMSASEIRTKVDAVAQLLKIEHVLSHAPKALSNGQKQRTALARALVSEPRVLLLDDPLRNVDAKLRFEMRLELPRLLADRGATIIYVTQDYKEAMALGDRIAVLDQGKIVQIGRRPTSTGGPPTRRSHSSSAIPRSTCSISFRRKTTGDCMVSSPTRGSTSTARFPGVAGRDCIVGLRPEALSFTERRAGFPVTIEAVTPFNEKTVTLLTTLRGREILLSQPAQDPVPPGPEVNLRIAAQDAILFDRETGNRIAPEPDGNRVEEAA